MIKMAGINKVILVGHLGKDPEVRFLEGNIMVASFPLATSEPITKNGVKEEHTEWHNIVLWRSLAEAAAKVLKKGKLIFFEGKCHTRSFEDKAGIKRYELLNNKSPQTLAAGDFNLNLITIGR